METIDSTIRILPGDTVCLTQILGPKAAIPNSSEQITGILSSAGISNGNPLEIIDEYKTDLVESIYCSYTCLLIKTSACLYLVEKLPPW